MAEPQRREVAPSTGPTGPISLDRGGQVEALLMDGLDRYFHGRYEDAIHLWTRVLFLDRSHTRARAYIDRARTALAERQRRADEMLHNSGELLTRGETDGARQLLAEAVAATGEDERAAALRLRLERVERVRGLAGGAVLQPSPTRNARHDAGPARRWRLVAIVGVACVVAGLAVGPLVRATVVWRLAEPALGAVATSRPRAILSSSDVALVRARTLYSRGRLAEALVALDRVESESPDRGVADQLRVEIQRALLQAGGAAGPETRGENEPPVNPSQQ